MAMRSDSLRLELQPFGITVIDQRTEVVKTNLIKNLHESQQPSLPKGSIYEPARQAIEKTMRQDGFEARVCQRKSGRNKDCNSAGRLSALMGNLELRKVVYGDCVLVSAFILSKLKGFAQLQDSRYLPRSHSYTSL